MKANAWVRWPARHPWWSGVLLSVAALLVGIVLTDWDWIRPSLERYVSQKTHRTFALDHLQVRLGWRPTVRLDGVYFGNAEWSKDEAMAKAERVEFDVSMRELFNRKILIPRIALTGADVTLEQLKDGRKNWLLSEPSDTSETAFEIGSLSITRSRVRFRDEKSAFELEVHADTFAPGAGRPASQAARADQEAQNDRYRTRFDFRGSYQKGKFEGFALTGDVLSFQKSGIFFPLKGEVRSSTTQLQVEGQIADAAELSGIDVRIHVAGETLASLYPFLLLPLPASPPYRLSGRLRLADAVYRLEDIEGSIGSTDIAGHGVYTPRSPRPLLEATLDSRQLVVADLGPLIGMETKESGGKPRPSPQQTRSRSEARAAERRMSGDRVLPAGRFEGERLKAIDADVTLRAARLKLTPDLPLESLDSRTVLKDGVLELDPLAFGLAGGQGRSRVRLDAREDSHLRSDVAIEARGIDIARLTPPKAQASLARGAGRISVTAKLRGQGDSVASAAGTANGDLAAFVSQGRISNLIDAAAGLNGGKALALLIGGDQNIPVRCGAIAFDVKAGSAKSNLFLLDTEQTEITGTGTVDLRGERIEVRITPLPKEAGFLSFRTPIVVEGSFRDPQVKLERGPLALRAGGALALGALAPPAALLALIEPGPGEDADCLKAERTAGAATGGRSGGGPRNRSAAADSGS